MKKVLSLLLVIVMAFSCFSVIAFTEEETAVEDTSFAGLTAAANYEAASEAYAAMTQEEKDAIDPYVFDDYLALVHSSYSKDLATYISENQAPKYFTEIMTNGQAITDAKTISAYTAAIKDMSAEAVAFYYTWYKNIKSSPTTSYYSMEANALYVFNQMASKKEGKVSETAYKELASSKAYAKSSYYNTYTAGTTEYKNYYKTYMLYSVGLYNIAQNYDRVLAVVEGAEGTVFENISLVIKTAADAQLLYEYVAAYQAAQSANAELYLRDSAEIYSFAYAACHPTGTFDPSATAMGDAYLAGYETFSTLYAALSDFEKAIINTSTFNAYGYIKEGTSDKVPYSRQQYSASALVDLCLEMKDYKYVQAFDKGIFQITSTGNETVADAKALYNAIPDALKGQVAVASFTKYKEILATIGPDTVVDNKIELSAYTAGNFDNSDAVYELITNALELINLDIPELLTSLYTNANVPAIAGLITALFEGAGGIVSAAGIASYPYELAEVITEDEFASLKSKLAAAETWDEVVCENGDWGFQDGDRDGFLAAVAMSLRDLGDDTAYMLGFTNVTNTNEGVYQYGIYEYLVPIFEMLELNPASSADYTAYIATAEGVVTRNGWKDAEILGVLLPVGTLLANIEAGGIDYVLELLPRLAYAIDSGLLQNQVNLLLENASIAGLGSLADLVIPEGEEYLDLSTGAIYDMMATALEEAGITLTKEQFCQLIKNLAACGDAVVKTSVARGTANRLAIVSNKYMAATVLADFLFKEFLADSGNVNVIMGLFGDINPIVTNMLNALLNLLQFAPSKYVYAFFALLLKIVGFFLKAYQLLVCFLT